MQTINIRDQSITPLQVEILRLRSITTNKDILTAYREFNNINTFAKEVLDGWCGIGIKTLIKMLGMLGMELPPKETK